MPRYLQLFVVATLLALCSSEMAETVPASLTESEWRRYLEVPPYQQPKWHRRGNPGTGNQPNAQLKRAAETHQDGDLEKATQLLKNILKNDANHGEAYAALAKVLNDQGKYELADKAMAKATRVYNDGLARGSLF